MKETMGLYVHIPFCQKKCHYCDFLTFARQEGMIKKYVDYLIKEMALYAKEDYLLDSIYFGGGTPSYLAAEEMDRIMQAIYAYFDVSEDCEISIEMNPESVTAEHLEVYLKHGFNRYTMGVQSFDDAVLTLMGRLHDGQTVRDRVDLLRKMGVKNLGIDLMFANPKQNMAILKSDLKQGLSLNPDHISYYSLMIKEGTPFARWVQTRQIQLIEDEAERDMYHYIQSELAKAGYQQYEISNFARPGAESRHNQKYWTLANYIGLGLGAHSNIDLVRYSNCRQFDHYFAKIDQGQKPIAYQEQLSLEDREKEYIMLNLRLIKGFAITELNQKFNINFEEKYRTAIDKHLKLGTVSIKDGQFTFTKFGLDVGNQFYLDIL
ncbi:radical SAM family heme chaperone HemW [Ignavigranum ruoffiae]|uniref:radical SAM family heme chaperone HemW n=1 Tax=Ignavigranum ruoffiae TaxID=89093 RepID=UPI003AFFDEED